MSYAASSSNATAKLARLTQTLRSTWTQARLTDRELMALRTELTRHSG